MTGSMSSELPPEVIAELTALDPAITPELAQRSWALLTPFHEKAGYTAPRIERDLAYGSHPRHRLDVHTGSATGADGALVPVVVFVHGGGFVGGDKYVPGTPRYDLFGAWAVRHGYVGVTMTYRLAPEFKWPSGAQDVAASIGWIREHIAAYGGDPDRIVVTGNSAGAVHVASYVVGQGGGRGADGGLPGVQGAALLSGIYRLRTMRPGEPGHAYYGLDPDPASATLPGLVASPVPLLFGVAERDPEAFQREAAAVVAAWQDKRGTVPDLVWVEGHNHMSTVGSLTVDEAALGVPLRRFIERNTRGEGQLA
jgi:acetyl esterase/lipase